MQSYNALIGILHPGVESFLEILCLWGESAKHIHSQIDS